MSELLQTFESAVNGYARSLEDFVDQYDLPKKWFYKPDHLALKCLDNEHYNEAVQAWQTAASQMSYVWLNGRRLASAHLQQPLRLGAFGSVEWLEIMEPRPEKVGKDTVGIDHVEFNFPDFASAKEVLDDRGVVYELQSNPNHEWLIIVINQLGQELKLNNRSLANIVAHELETGQAEML